MQTFFKNRNESLAGASFVVDNTQVCVKGERACLDTATGNVKPAQAGITTLLPIGVFTESLTGDGTKTTYVKFDEEIRAQQWLNDTAPNNVVAATTGSEVYLKDGRTVTTSSGGNSKAGIVLGIDASTSRVIVASGLRRSGATGSPGTGMLKLPFGFGTADAAALYTVPAGYALKITEDPFWDVTADFTGGSSSAIGISTDDTTGTNASTKGDILGGATGDVAATLTATGSPKAGTAGAKMDTIAHRQGIILHAGKKIRFDRITSAFTAGAGFVCVPCVLYPVG